MREYSRILIKDIPEETKQHFRQVFKEVIEDIVTKKIVHRQDEYHHCQAAHCVLGHVELRILEEIGDRGKYFQLKDGCFYLDENGCRSCYSRMILDFASFNGIGLGADYIGEWGAAFLGVNFVEKALSDKSPRIGNLIGARLTIFEIVGNWNEIVKGCNWSETLVLGSKCFWLAAIT